MRVPVPAAVVALLVALTPAAGEARVAFVGLEGLGLDRGAVRPIERLLERALADLVGGDLMSPDQVMAGLLDPDLQRLQECHGQVSCLLDLGGVLEVEQVVYGTLTQLGENYAVVLRLIDVEAGNEKSRVRKQLSGSQDQLVDIVRSAAVQLLDPEKYRGGLVIDDLVPGATVKIDGTSVEAVAGEALKVTVGQHTVTIEAEGYHTQSFLVSIGLGEMAHVTPEGVIIEATTDTVQTPSTVSWLRWWPFVAMGVGAASLIATGTLGVLTVEEKNNFERAYRHHELEATEFAARASRGQSYALWTNITLGLGLAAASIGVAGWLFQGDEGSPPGPLATFWHEWRRPLIFGAGGASLVAGFGFGILALMEASAYGTDYEAGLYEPAVFAQRYNRGRDFAVWSNILIGTGLCVTVAGLLDWLFLSSDDPRSEVRTP